MAYRIVVGAMALALALAGLVWTAPASAGRIVTVAGMELEEGVKVPRGWIGDGGPATGALLSNPFGVGMDAQGNLYIADSSHNLIRKVDPSGRIVTVAGSGWYGYSGDGGRATDARMATPLGLFVAGDGSLYIADTFNHRVRRVDASGAITTVAGTGMRGFGGDGGPATEALLSTPTGVFVDRDGAVYIADQGNHRVRRVDASGSIATVAGSGVWGFGGDGGAATEALLADPSGVYVDGQGNLFVADRSNYRVRKVDASGLITTVAGNGEGGYSGDGGAATEARLRIPSSVFVDGWGNLYIADRGNSRIRRVDASGVITTVAGIGLPAFGGDGGSAVAAGLARPYGLFLDGAGALWVADTENHRVRRVDAPQRMVRIRRDVGEIAADGVAAATVQVEVAAPSGAPAGDVVPVRFRILEGQGELSEREVLAVGGRAVTRVTSRRPGLVVVAAEVEGAWGATASVEVAPVAALSVSAGPGTIPGNGFDVAVVDAHVVGLGGASVSHATEVRFRIVGGDGELLAESAPVVAGRASVGLVSRTPGRVQVEALAPGAFPATVRVLVAEPTPGQLPDRFEPDQGLEQAGRIATDGVPQARTIHTRGEVDWVTFEAREGYLYTAVASGEPAVEIEVFRDGASTGRYRGRAEFWLREGEGGAVFLALRAPDGGTGRYEVSVSERRAAVLALSAGGERIAADGADAAVIRVAVQDLDGALQMRDNESRVAFEVVAGDGELSAGEAVVTGGVAEVRLTASRPGPVTVRVSLAGVAPATVVVRTTPAVVLDLDPASGDQAVRMAAGAPEVGDRISVDLVALSGAEGMIGFRALLRYDPSKLAFEAFREAGLMAQGTSLLTFPEAGEVEVNTVILNGRAVEDGGSLGLATFRVLEGFAGETRVSLVSLAYGGPRGEQDLAVGAETGSVLLGQPAGDAPLTFADFRRAFGRRAGEPGYETRLDLDGDGTIGFADFVLFSRNSDGRQ